MMTRDVNVALQIEHEDIVCDDSYCRDEEVDTETGPADEIVNEENSPIESTSDLEATMIDETEVLEMPGVASAESETSDNAADTDEGELPDLDKLIAELPGDFPRAAPIIKSKIAPKLAECDAGLVDHYVQLMKKKTGAATKRAVTLIIAEVKKSATSEDLGGTHAEDQEVEIDPEVQQRADEIARDPLLVEKRLEIVEQLGVIGERKNAALYLTIMDSRLLPMGLAGSNALAMKNSGWYGAGKSYPMLMCLKVFPKKSYHLISSGSAKSVYYIEGGLKHKALILTEALQLQSDYSGDNELAYSVRTLLSEGHLAYQYTGYVDGEKVTIVKRLEGPTSLITTTIKGRLEDQLEDRLITVNPDASPEQTGKIITRSADVVSGTYVQVDDRIIKAWVHFHGSLETVEVIIPFVHRISEYVNMDRELPLSARRSFNRVLSAIKSVALLHQYQRQRDEHGRIVAEHSDYFTAFQMMEEPFRESLGDEKYTDRRIRLVQTHGALTPGKLAKMEGVKGSSISEWSKRWFERGVLIWVDENGDIFPNEETLGKAKRSGKAYMKVCDAQSLPTPFQITGDSRWDVGGELYERYNLEFDRGITEIEVPIGDDDGLSAAPNTSDDGYSVDNIEDNDNEEQGVRVLGGISQKEFMKKIREEAAQQPECDPNDPELLELVEEFRPFLKDSESKVSKEQNPVTNTPPGEHEPHTDGLLTI